MLHWKNAYFYTEDGQRMIPLGLFSSYFRTAPLGEESRIASTHGRDLVEFQRCTRSVWQKQFRYLATEDGCTAIRMFPRGDSSGSAWEGLDIGGRVNRPLLRHIKAFLADARPYGIRLHLPLLTEPECSFYCQPDTRSYWGRRLWTEAEIDAASPSQQRFLRNPQDLVSYEDFFTDPDVRDCCHRFLDEIIPLLADFDDLLAVEIFNEAGWASPHARPANTFRWEITPDYLDFLRDMTAHIRRLAPQLPIAISNPGVGLLGHDPVQWAQAIRPDFFSLHSYPDICGLYAGLSYAEITDATLLYTASAVPTMLGEWQAVFGIAHTEDEHEALTLACRDMVWLTLLSGAAGCLAWRAPGYGQYHAVHAVFESIHAPLIPDADAEHILVVNIAAEQAHLASMWQDGTEDCAYPPTLWCPDCAATDGKHRYCRKGTSAEFRAIMQAELWSLRHGIPLRFSLTDGLPLSSLTEADVTARTPFAKPIDGYRQKAFSADGGHTALVYLYNDVNIRAMVTQPDGSSEAFDGRTRRAVPFRLDGLAPAYTATLFDLDTRTAIPIENGYDGGITDHDFVLILQKETAI